MSTTELVPSVSIENLVNQRAAVIERVNAAIDRMNKIIAKHYPGALPAPK